MELTLNNRPEILDLSGSQATVSEILKVKNFTFPRIIVRLNGDLVKKTNYDNTLVKAGDNLEIIHLISGG